MWKEKATQSCSWNWMCLLNLREVFKTLMVHIIGDGQNTNLWYDNWYPLGRPGLVGLWLATNGDGLMLP